MMMECASRRDELKVHAPLTAPRAGAWNQGRTLVWAVEACGSFIIRATTWQAPDLTQGPGPEAASGTLGPASWLHQAARV